MQSMRMSVRFVAARTRLVLTTPGATVAAREGRLRASRSYMSLIRGRWDSRERLLRSNIICTNSGADYICQIY